ncbi:hypothetical protein NDA16_003643 [Ustilago loliicola]|nr:hypothetical protein NDA16_003643 [Ustilago loliicola]
MKLNFAIVALALSSSALTLAAPLPLPQTGGITDVLKKVAGRFVGKKSRERESVFADSYVPDDAYPELSDKTHPYVPGRKKALEDLEASGGSSHLHDTVQHLDSSPEVSPHRSYGGGSQSARYPSHNNDAYSGGWPPKNPSHSQQSVQGGDIVPSQPAPAAPDNHVGMHHIGPHDYYYYPRNDQSAPPNVPYPQSYGGNEYGYSHPQPGYSHPQPGYSHPQPGYGYAAEYPQPVGGYSHPYDLPGVPLHEQYDPYAYPATPAEDRINHFW